MKLIINSIEVTGTVDECIDFLKKYCAEFTPNLDLNYPTWPKIPEPYVNPFPSQPEISPFYPNFPNIRYACEEDNCKYCTTGFTPGDSCTDTKCMHKANKSKGTNTELREAD